MLLNFDALGTLGTGVLFLHLVCVLIAADLGFMLVRLDALGTRSGERCLLLLLLLLLAADLGFMLVRLRTVGTLGTGVLFFCLVLVSLLAAADLVFMLVRLHALDTLGTGVLFLLLLILLAACLKLAFPVVCRFVIGRLLVVKDVAGKIVVGFLCRLLVSGGRSVLYQHAV